jgi:choline dehydrogenase-like flavoprotein
VIGAGAAGAAVAWMLARAGIGVVCLEQGDWVDPRAFPHWRADWDSGARLQTRARVRAITLGPDGRADGALYHDREEHLHEQKARAVVLAANGIGTPRLLLHSRSAAFPDGLANRSGLVGRNLMFHPYALVRGLFDRPLGGHRGPIGCSIISQEFLRAGGWHLMGTARMGRNPATSVIDPEGRCHDVPNLYIVDGSTMVTCAAVNPTSTIPAVALSIADGMIRRRS